jgi:glutamate-1-semialdehyde 2,1-aminomutase
MKAIKEQLECGTVLGGPTELEIRLAEKILESLPSGEQVIFCASGTEANMLGLRVVRAYTGKEKILKCEGAFHGTAIDFSEGPGISEDVAAKALSVPFNDIERFEAAVKRHRDELAAVFMEPILRGIPPRPDYLKQVEKITRENGVLLVFDEVVTGFRLSRGELKEMGVKPDMTLLGKLIGGGFAVGALVTRKELLKPFKSTKMAGLSVDRPPFLTPGPECPSRGHGRRAGDPGRAHRALMPIGRGRKTLRQGWRRPLRRRVSWPRLWVSVPFSISTLQTRPSWIRPQRRRESPPFALL